MSTNYNGFVVPIFPFGKSVNLQPRLAHWEIHFKSEMNEKKFHLAWPWKAHLMEKI